MKPESKKNFSDQSGMTLVEIMAVIVLIGLIMVVVVKGVIGKSDAAKARLNQVQMEKLKSTLAQYRLEYNSYPDKLEDLMHGGGASSSKVFVPMAEERDLKDVWENPFQYKSEGNGRSYSLTSLGSDGMPGGDGAKQDVTVTP